MDSKISCNGSDKKGLVCTVYIKNYGIAYFNEKVFVVQFLELFQ